MTEKADQIGIALGFSPMDLESPNIIHICEALNVLFNAYPKTVFQLFLKSKAVLFLNSQDALCRLPLPERYQLSCCSTAAEQFLAPDPATPCQISGLGFWVMLTNEVPCFDFTTPAISPHCIVITKHPKYPEFLDALDLALACAAFDFEPSLILLGEATQVLTQQWQETTVGKRLASAAIYGINKVLNESEHFDEIQLLLLSHPCTHISQQESVPDSKPLHIYFESYSHGVPPRTCLIFNENSSNVA